MNFLLRGRTIRGKLNAILALTTVAALLVAGVALVVVDFRKGLDNTREDIVTLADVIAFASAPALTFADARVGADNLAVLRGKPQVSAAALYDDQGRLFASYVPAGQRRTVPPQALPAGVSIDGEWATASRPVYSGNEQVGSIYMELRHNQLRELLEYMGVLVLVMGGSLASALLLSNRLQRAVTEPIRGVSEVAQKILRGETADLRATRTSDDEVGALVEAFNAMLDELGQRARTLEEANRALLASDARYQLAVRGSSAGLWDWDIPSGTLFFSPRFKALLGYAPQEMPDVPATIRQLLHPEDRPVVRAAMRAHLHERKPYQVECRLRDRSGAWRWFFVAGAALWDEAGKPYRMAGSVVEVTERKQAEQVLQEANRAKDEFLATLAHELRNPLAPIRTGLEILKMDKANGPSSQKARATMERQLAHMVRLIDDLLDISRINSGKIRLEVGRIRLRSVVDLALEIGRPYVTAGGHALDVQLPAEDDIALMGDPTRLAQALGNLLNNAAKYTPSGGRIMLRVRREAGEAVVEVEDTGEGLPPEALENVFALFTQVGRTIDRSHGGLGIGLYLVRSLVQLHGGTVVAASPGVGRGSTFTVRLPALPPDAQDVPPAAPAVDGADPSGLKVLVVDDNVDAAETLSMVLQMSGCSVRTVHDGTSVLEAALQFGPQVVLLDIGLPGMSGYEVAQQLRRQPALRGAMLVAVTGWGAEQDRRRAKEAGFDHHLTKPVDFASLVPLLHALQPAA